MAMGSGTWLRLIVYGRGCTVRCLALVGAANTELILPSVAVRAESVWIRASFQASTASYGLTTTSCDVVASRSTWRGDMSRGPM